MPVVAHVVRMERAYSRSSSATVSAKCVPRTASHGSPTSRSICGET